MGKKILKLDPQIQEEYLVAGIISGFKNYRICFELNKNLKIDLSRVEDFTLESDRPGSMTCHAKYKWKGDFADTCVLLSNKDTRSTGYFCPEYKNIDYFLIFDAPLSVDDFEKCKQKIRDIDVITGVYEIDLKKIKSADAFYILLQI